LIARAQTLIPETWPGSEFMKGEKTWLLPTSATLRMLARVEKINHGPPFVADEALADEVSQPAAAPSLPTRLHRARGWRRRAILSRWCR
jgi:hypothetical protein